MGRKKLNRAYKGLHVKLVPSEHEALDYYCQRNQVTMSEVVRRLLEPIIDEGKTMMERDRK